MRTLDRYIFWQVLKPVGVALVVALVVLMLERMLSLLDLILGAEGPLRLLVEIMSYLVPQYIALALPISLLLGVMIAFNQLGRNSELDAFQTGGVGLWRQARAAFLLALIVMAITALTLGYLKPFGRYAYQSAVFVVTKAAFHVLLRAGVFTEFGDGTFLIDEIRSSDGTLVGVFFYEAREGGGSSVITARTGALARGADGGLPILRLFEGERISVAPPADGKAAEGQSFGVLHFAELRKVLTDEGASLFRPRGLDEREFTLTELWQNRKTPPVGVRRSDMVAEFHGRLVRILTVAVLPCLAIALSIGRRRSDRSYGIAIGVVSLILYNQVLDLGENIAEKGKFSPFVSLWLPFLLFAVASAWGFARIAFRVPRSLSFAWAGRITDLGGAAARRLLPRRLMP
jgi:lipopolysaccharide export system permease protein